MEHVCSCGAAKHHITTCPPSRTWERIGRAKARKLMDRDKGGFISKRKQRGKKIYKGNHLPPPTSRMTFSQTPCSCYLPKCPFTQFLLVNMTLHGTEYLWSIWAFCPGCVPSQLLARPWPIHCWEQGGKKKKYRLWRFFSAISKHWCVIYTALVTNPEHRRIWATLKKINSIQDRLNPTVHSKCLESRWTRLITKWLKRKKKANNLIHFMYEYWHI